MISKTHTAIIHSVKVGYRADTKNGVVYNPRKARIGTVNSLGYEKVHLPCGDGKYVNVHSHRFIAFCLWGEAVFGSQKDVEIRHLDGNKLNNREDNLAIGTSSQNKFDRSSESLSTHARKWVDKLTEEQKIERSKKISKKVSDAWKRRKIKLDNDKVF